MRIPPIALAGALALALAPALTACSSGTPVNSSAKPASAAPITATTLPPSAAPSQQVPAPNGPATSQVTSTAASPPVGGGVSQSDLTALDQSLSDANNALGADAQDATHNETGDAKP
jgi:hypothetical protein